MKVALGSDHGGFLLKETIRAVLPELGHHAVDFGTHSSESVDWPDFIYPAALSVAMGECDRAILVDGVGYSSGMLANMLPGVYAAVCFDTFSARMSQQHSNANVLCLGGKVLGEAVALEIVRIFLESKFLGGKYQKRIDKFKAIEDRHLSPFDKSVLRQEGSSEEVKPQDLVLTAEDIRAVIQSGKRPAFRKGTTLTPSAREVLRDYGVDPDELLERQ